MCGIAGIYHKKRTNLDSSNLVSKLLEPIQYRGPDNKTIIHLNNVSLGHLRLSIIDLSVDANQPMYSASKEGLVIVFNGEIYNYLELRDILKIKYRFTTNSDTEVILNSYLEWGENCVNHFNGMWAFAIYDSEKNKLFCSRDRFGIKPFYYVEDENTFVFASEIKCFKNLKNFKFEANLEAIADNLIYGPLSFGQTQIREVFELENGCNLILENNLIQTIKYYAIENTFQTKNDDIDLEYLDYLLNDSVRLRLQADVPVATLNSGGLDSSLISAIAKNRNEDLTTFSVAPELINGFVQVGDESEHAKTLAEHIGSKLHILRYSEREFLELMDQITFLNDGELYHSNSVPLYMLFKKIKSLGITVVLSGEGADEVFRGYSSNFRFRLSGLLPKKGFLFLMNKRINGKKYFIEEFDNYRKSVSMINSLYVEKGKTEEYLGIEYDLLPERKELFQVMNNLAPESAITYFEQKTYLAGLLRRLDRMSMANSIESRVPFLDHRIVDYMNSIPLNKKVGIHQKSVKVLLKKISEPYIPKSIIERTKRGFSTPVNDYSNVKNLDGRFSNEEYYYLKNVDIRNTFPRFENSLHF